MKMRFIKLPNSWHIAPAVALAFGLFSAPSARSAVIGHWTFNEDGGATAIDSSGQNNHGTIRGGAAYVASVGGTAISLDGIDDNVNFGQPAILDFTDDSFSIEIWVAIDASQSANEYSVFGKNGQSWLMGYLHDGGVFPQHNVQLCSDAGCTVAHASFDPTPHGTYQHVVFTKSIGSGSAFYIDGELNSAGGGSIPIYSSAADVIAGGTDSGTDKLKCMIDEIKVHDIQISEAAVSNSFAAGASTAPSPIPQSSDVELDNVLTTGFESREGKRYELECTENLVAPNWTSASPAFVIGNGALMSLSDPTGGPTTKYYRLTVE